MTTKKIMEERKAKGLHPIYGCTMEEYREALKNIRNSPEFLARLDKEWDQVFGKKEEKT